MCSKHCSTAPKLLHKVNSEQLPGLGHPYPRKMESQGKPTQYCWLSPELSTSITQHCKSCFNNTEVLASTRVQKHDVARLYSEYLSLAHTETEVRRWLSPRHHRQKWPDVLGQGTVPSRPGRGLHGNIDPVCLVIRTFHVQTGWISYCLNLWTLDLSELASL